jgi:hypothetical protein
LTFKYFLSFLKRIKKLISLSKNLTEVNILKINHK